MNSMAQKTQKLHDFSMNFSIFFLFFFLFPSLVSFSSSTGETATHSEFYVPTKTLWPYDWSYIRIELPQNFSSATIALESDVDLDLKKLHKYSKEKLPIICFKDGNPPLPDFSRDSLKGLVINHYNVSDGNIQYLQNVDQCYPLQKRITFKMAYGEFVPGVYYAGMFNGLGDIRNQPNMIRSGFVYSFNANVTVERCADPEKQGQYCDHTVEDLGYMDGYVLNYTRSLCLVNMEPKIYSLSTNMPVQITVKARDIRLNHTLSVESGLSMMCRARSNGIPDEFLYDYSSDLIESPIFIPSPKGYNWYFTIQATYEPNLQSEGPKQGIEVCLSVDWEVIYCPEGTDGPNCVWKEYFLQEVDLYTPNVNSIFLPEGNNKTSESANFSLDPLLSKSGEESGYAWTYFYMWVNPTNSDIHIQLASERKLDYEIYVRYDGLATSELWDYRYSNGKIYGKKNSLFKLYDSTGERVNLFLLYAREGCLFIGLRHPLPLKMNSNNHTTMSVSSETCPNRCSHHGTCYSTRELSGSTFYCFCSCDPDRGGFDCSVELRPKWHSVLLVATNVVAILPAFRALYQKECPEWVVFMASGIASAFYHDCDEHRYCVLPFRVLQFMDFWLSFLAVVSTFVYLTNVDESIKRTVHTIAAIITALLAITSPTRSSNIPIVFSLGATGLLMGWLIELLKRNKSFSFPPTRARIPKRWSVVKVWFLDLVGEANKYFRWVYLLLGFIALVMAAISKAMENPQNYWKWHSLWHVSIYACPFFFLCAKASMRNGDVEEASETALSYELAETQERSQDDGVPKAQNGKSGETIS